MASIIIPVKKSLTATRKFPTKYINKDIISVGNDLDNNYLSYLFFDISSIPCNVSICHAELILFKMDKFYNDSHKIFSIYPLNQYFNSCTCCNNLPEINSIIEQDFYPITSNSFVKIPLTSFVRLWVKNRFVPASIMLYGKSKNSLVHFSSAICANKCLAPYLKVTFKPCCNNNPTLKQIQLIGTVGAESKYIAVVNVQVLRNCLNHVDNYYVVDEYDNSKNNTPLHIDETYNIAIFPREKVGDTEIITFYGSYKE